MMFFHRYLPPIFIFFAAFFPASRAETPTLLARALEQWAHAREDLAFTQQTRIFHDDGKLKEERIERYDPSLSDNLRWRLLEVDGRPASAEERKKWETKKNGKPRKHALKPPGEYLDLEHARLLDAPPAEARFELGLRPQTARLLAV